MLFAMGNALRKNIEETVRRRNFRLLNTARYIFPLFIFNFAEYLDENIDVVGLLKRATDLGGQVFLFTGGYEIEGLKDKEGVQILE